MPRLSITIMIEQDLGYCCPWFFFHHYKSTALVAARLGVSTRAVRYAKEDCREAGPTCPRREGCMHAKITLAGDPRKRVLTTPRS